MPSISSTKRSEHTFSERAKHHRDQASTHKGSSARHQRSAAKNTKRAEEERASHVRHQDIPKDWEPSSLGEVLVTVVSVITLPFTVPFILVGRFVSRLATEHPAIVGTAVLAALVGKTVADSTVNTRAVISNASALQNLNSTGDYSLSNDIDMTGLEPNNTEAFAGTLDGAGYAVKGLNACLFKDLTGNVSNINFLNANVTGTSDIGPLGVVACKVTGNGQIANTTVRNSEINLTGFNAKGGFATGKMLGNGKIINFSSVNNSIKASGQSSMGFAVGLTDGSAQVQNITALASTMEGTTGKMAVAVGEMKGKSNVTAVTCVQSTLSASSGADMGVGAGHLGENTHVSHVTASSCSLRNMGSGSKTGMGAGNVASTTKSQVRGVTCLNSSIRFNATSDNEASIGSGHSSAFSLPTNVTSYNCEIQSLLNNATADFSSVCAFSAPSIVSPDCSPVELPPSSAQPESLMKSDWAKYGIGAIVGAGVMGAAWLLKESVLYLKNRKNNKDDVVKKKMLTTDSDDPEMIRLNP